MWLLLTTAIWSVGCTQEPLTDELPSEHNRILLSLTTRADERIVASGNESVINTLRLMAFDNAGVQVANSFYEGALLESLKGTGGTYTVTERLPGGLGQIRVCLIANEPSSWNLGRTTGKVSYASLQSLNIRYDRDFDFINNNSNEDDLNLYISPDDYFLMYVEKNVNFVAGDVSVAEVLPLKRTAAKVTLTLSHDLLADVDYGNGEDFLLKSVSIQNQPIYSYLFAGVYDNDEFFSTAYHPLTYQPDGKSTQAVVFYIPEYYLSADAFDSGLFTYIEVLGEYITGGTNVPVIYKIPLGEGVQQMYADANYVPTMNDYSVVRNHHYVVDGRVTKLGEKEGIQTKVSIAPWIDGGNVDVEDGAPYLNVSDVALQQTVYSSVPDVANKIFFWSNQSQNLITLSTVTSVCYDSGGLEVDLAPLPANEKPQVDVNLIQYSTTLNGSGFFENNGHVAIDVKLPSNLLWNKLVVTFHLQAGNLKRQVTMTYITGII